METLYRDELLFGLTDEVAMVLDRCGDPVSLVPIVGGSVHTLWRGFDSRPPEPAV